MAGGFWGIITIVGPILLLAVLVFAVMRNRATPREERRTEEGTKALYREEDKHTENDTAV